jgi:hypothetical protein
VSAAQQQTVADIIRAPFPKEHMGRRRVFLDGLDLLLELYRQEGMTELELREGLQAKIREMNIAQGDAA